VKIDDRVIHDRLRIEDWRINDPIINLQCAYLLSNSPNVSGATLPPLRIATARRVVSARRLPGFGHKRAPTVAAPLGSTTCFAS
jgi:hypothetical protein